LLVDKTAEDVSNFVTTLRRELEAIGAPARAAVAWYPRDGRTVDALISAAGAQLRPPRARTVEFAAVSDPPPRTDAMERVNQLATRAASSNINVLIVGECGVGKEVLARRVHELSARKGKPFVALNCGAIAESLVEDELFGHEKGAFTNAHQGRPGVFEMAEGGTVFLDEIGEMPPAMQVRLLRALENRVIRRVGGTRDVRIDVRIIAATNRDVEADVLAERFRKDLYFRLNGITLAIPPLRERRNEIEPLARAFLAQACRDAGRPDLVLPEEVLALLSSYSWPGNVRELKNMIERAVALCDGPEILPEHLMLEKIALAPLDNPADAALPPAELIAQPVGDECARLKAALEENGYNQTRAARALGIPRRTFVYKLSRCPEIRRPRGGAKP
jgi:DNA-binding NtrC family response regulator